MSLIGKVAIITGGTSGIGQATARLFCREGAKVVAVGRTWSKGEETIQLIRKEGGDALYIQGDVSKAVDVQSMVNRTLEKYGRIDILFNNAGMQLFYKPLEETSEEEWDEIIRVNLKSVFLCSKYVVPVMKRQGGGVIINTASTLGFVGQAGFVAYCASKGGVIQLTKALALELAPYNIRVNCVCPGTTVKATDKGFIAYGKLLDPEKVKERVRLHPLGRLATPEDVANAVLFLASDRSSFITGSALVIDGGYTAQ